MDGNIDETIEYDGLFLNTDVKANFDLNQTIPYTLNIAKLQYNILQILNGFR